MIKKPAKGAPSVVIDGLIDECMEFTANFTDSRRSMPAS